MEALDEERGGDLGVQGEVDGRDGVHVGVGQK